MVGRKRGKDRRAIALKVWEMAAIFVFPFHAYTNTTSPRTGEDARAYILAVVLEWEKCEEQWLCNAQ